MSLLVPLPPPQPPRHRLIPRQPGVKPVNSPRLTGRVCSLTGRGQDWSDLVPHLSRQHWASSSCSDALLKSISTATAWTQCEPPTLQMTCSFVNNSLTRLPSPRPLPLFFCSASSGLLVFSRFRKFRREPYNISRQFGP